MKKITTIIILLATAFASKAQNELVINGTTLQINTGATLFVNGSIINNPLGGISNNGTIQVTGNFTNNGGGGSNGGSWIFNGTSPQTITSSTEFALNNFTINNAAGMNLNALLTVNNTATFTNGIVNAPSAATPFYFAPGANVSGTASNASHVNGYAQAVFLGNFTFPVGDGIRYQKVDVNNSVANGYTLVKYFGSNAGAAPFTTGGTEAVPLVSYNTNEYWDISTFGGTNTGTVTMYWDGYKDGFSNPAAQRRVAHKVGGNWLNEGTIGTGTTAAGSVTSNSISNWSPFALGSVATVLPVKWLSVTGNVSASNNATINWLVAEQNVAQYDIQKSNDGRSFFNIGSVATKGNGEHNYSFTEAAISAGVAFYRIRQIDIDGRSSLSSIVKLGGTNEKAVSVYPTPARTTVVVTVPQNLVATNATLFDNTGKQVRTILLSNTASTIDVSTLANGVYVLRFANGSSAKLVKE